MSSKFGGIFDSVFTPKPPRNKFDLSFDSIGDYRIGLVYPVCCLPVIPGDKFRINQEMLVRAMPMVAPAFGNLKLYTHYFFVPNRLVWDRWEDFITGGEDGDYVGIPKSLPLNYICQQITDESSPYKDLIPVFLPDGLFDHLYGFCFDSADVMKTCTDTTPIDLTPIAMYALIGQEYYRDQNVQNDVKLELEAFRTSNNAANLFNATMNLITSMAYSFSGATGVTPDAGGHFSRCYIKDYFTSALPFVQRGPDVTLPITGDVLIDQDKSVNGVQFTGSSTLPENSPVTTGDGGSAFALEANNQQLKYNAGLIGDLKDVTSATINDLRRAIALQRFYEISARGGSRYIEQILAHFHVRSSDARLQRPEYIGGGVTPIQVGEVFQTSNTVEDSPQGNLAGRGVGYGRSNGVYFSSEEHGYIIGLISFMPPAYYFQGVDAVFTKTDRLDYPWPSFGNLGEQEIKKSELLVDTSGVDNFGQLFGYTPRYAEYKYKKDTLHGAMRSSLQYWTWARRLKDNANLNGSFLIVPNITTPFAVTEEKSNPFVIWISSSIDVLRELPYYGTPSSLGI